LEETRRKDEKKKRRKEEKKKKNRTESVLGRPNTTADGATVTPVDLQDTVEIHFKR
jgi:hypothetical protein